MGATTISIELSEDASIEQADKMVKKFLACLNEKEINYVIGCNIQSLVMSMEMPMDKDEDYGV